MRPRSEKPIPTLSPVLSSAEEDFVGPSQDAEELTITLDGYQGPLALMLDLARREKLDLKAISMPVLAEQYLAFIATAKALRLELAGDYLVMAAWLTYLKSRLLLPELPQSDVPAAAELAQDLADRLHRLEAIRRAGDHLALLAEGAGGRFARGATENTIIARRRAWDVDLNQLVLAYLHRRLAEMGTHIRIAPRCGISIPEARAMLERLIGGHAEWCPLDLLIVAIAPEGAQQRGARASSFAALLELAREGRIILRQERGFAPLFLRRAEEKRAGGLP